MKAFNKQQTLYTYTPSTAGELAGQAPPLPYAKPQRAGWRRWLRRIAVLIIISALAYGGWIGWRLYRDAANLTGNKNPLALFGAFKSDPLKTSDGRVNILLTGYSVDDPGHAGAGLTDSIMVLSIDTTTHKAAIISVPRDLWVKVEGVGYEKINAAIYNDDFSAAGYPQGGVGQLEKEVNDALGLRINYYALINYTAFKEAVDAVGGVTLTIDSDDKRGLYDPNANLKLPNGQVNLDGETALNLARARGDNYYAYGFPAGDFDRTEHQRQLVMALKDKVNSSNTLTNPLKIPNLADAAGNNVKTDMSLGELQSLVKLVKDVNDGNITSVNLNKIGSETLLQSFTTYNYQYAFMPVAGVDDFSDIHTAVDSLLASISAPPPTTSSSQ